VADSGCGCGGGSKPVNGWQLIAPMQLAMANPVATEPAPAAPQPGRAPAERSGWPWWAWVVLALVVLHLVRAA
jgi:hypothetical protein